MKTPQDIQYCYYHPETKLICPRCQAKKGGAATAKKYGTRQLAKWGQKGGRSKRKPAAASRKK